MANVCVLTDSTAQFPIPAFPGRNLVHIQPLHVQVDDVVHEKSADLRAADLPRSARNGPHTKALPPTQEEFEKMYAYLGQYYEEIIVLTHSGLLTRTFENAHNAANMIEGRLKIYPIDTGTTATGLGLVTQAAAAAAEEKIDGAEIERSIRSMLQRVYSVFCIEGLTYLHNSGYLNPSQALVGEFLKVLPIYTLDAENFTPTLKARNYRHLVDLLHEFICEFEELEHIALIQGVPSFENESRGLRERLNEDYPDTPVSEHTIGPELAAMFGPRSLGMFLYQRE